MEIIFLVIQEDHWEKYVTKVIAAHRQECSANDAVAKDPHYRTIQQIELED